MMRFHRYDVEFVFEKRVNLVIADTLSRAYLATTEGSVDGRHKILLLSTIGDTDMPDIRLQEIRNSVAKDSDMQTLIEVIINGWSENKHNPPESVRQYFDFRETLSYEDGLVLKDVERRSNRHS
jgi:hypothetical protein